MKRATCYIIAAGEHYSAPSEPDSGNMVIAADGGYDYLCGFNIKPDLIIGDFDSLGLVPSGSSVIKLPAVKDNTYIRQIQDRKVFPCRRWCHTCKWYSV